MQDRIRDSDDEDFRDRDYDIAALANNLSQAFRYGLYNGDDVEEVPSKMFLTVLALKVLLTCISNGGLGINSYTMHF